MTDAEFLSRRIVRLETRLRWMTRGAFLAGILIMTGAVMAQVKGTFRAVEDQRDTSRTIEELIRAKQFTLVDGKGNDRASLVADNAGSIFLVMFDNAGKTRVNLSVGNEGPSLVFYDPSGQPRTIIGSTTLVGSHVNENGIAERSPPSSIVLFDKTGKLLWRQP
jgi:hypothetical protein